MIILGVSDSRDTGAALVIDGELVAVEREERYARQRHTRQFPWTSIDLCLEAAGLRNRDVDIIAVAGRFSPPLIARRHPGLRPVLKPSAFSPFLDVEVFFQAMLRQTGLGAADADRASEWFEGVFSARGFKAQRVVMVDVHKALAAAAYQCQSDDDVLALTMQPLGDGVSFAVHLCNAGQIDRAWNQKGFSSLHVHLQRCSGAMGLQPWVESRQLWSLASRGAPDADLTHVLDRTLRADGARLAPRRYPVPTHRGAPIYRALSDAQPEVAAASVLENLTDVVCELVKFHVREQGVRDVVLGGAVWDNARLVAAVAALSDVDNVWCSPAPGWAELATGAACAVGGVAPHALPVGLGQEWAQSQISRALAAAGLRGVEASDRAETTAGLLADGGGVARFGGRGGFGWTAMGTRSVLVRADDVQAVATVREQLRRGQGDQPTLAWMATPDDGEITDLKKAWEASRFGTVAFEIDEQFAARYPAGVTPDGRVHLMRVDPDGDAELHSILAALHRRTGCAAVVCFPLAMDSDPTVSVPGDALRVWKESDISSLLIGPFLVRQ